MRLLPSIAPANSVQVSHRRPTPASSWPQWRGSCLGPGFRVFSLHVNRPTSQCCSVSQYIGRKCISGSGRSTLPSGAGTQGTKQQEIAHSSCCYWRVLVVRPTQSAGQQQCCQPEKACQALPEQGLVGRDGRDVRTADRCASQCARVVPRTDQRVQHNQGPGSHRLYR